MTPITIYIYIYTHKERHSMLHSNFDRISPAPGRCLLVVAHALSAAVGHVKRCRAQLWSTEGADAPVVPVMEISTLLGGEDLVKTTIGEKSRNSSRFPKYMAMKCQFSCKSKGEMVG